MDRIGAQLRCRIGLVAPPAGVAFCLQKGRDECIDSVVSTGDPLTFDFDVKIGAQKDGSPNFLGPFTQERFVYLCVGQRAGQHDSFIDGRVKVPLRDIAWQLIDEVLADEDHILVAFYQASNARGQVVKASVPLLEPGWRCQSKLSLE